VKSIGKSDEPKGPEKNVQKLPKPSSRKKKGKNGKDKAKDDDDFYEVIAQLEAENRNLFEGINLTKIQLLNSNGIDLITSIDKSKIRDYEPVSVIVFRVALDRNGSKEPKMYFFDSDVFDPLMSKELAVRCILKVSGFKVDGESKIDRYWTPSAIGTSNVESLSEAPAAIHQDSADETSLKARLNYRLSREFDEVLDACRRTDMMERAAQLQKKFETWKKSKKPKDKHQLSMDDMWREIIEQNSSKILFFQISSILAIVSEDTLMKSSNLMRFSVYTFIPSSHDMMRVIVDPEIIEGELSKSILNLLLDIGKQKTSSVSYIKILESRPLWITELQEIDLVLNGKDPDRVKGLRAVRYIKVYDSVYESARNLEWIPFGTPLDILNPVGWDQVSASKRILASLMEEDALKALSKHPKNLDSKKPPSGNQLPNISTTQGNNKMTENRYDKIKKPIQADSAQMSTSTPIPSDKPVK
jgi:hypothetical protein